MKRENIYLVGATLLASTALTTAASAAAFYFSNNSANLGGAFSTTSRPLSAQVFASSPSTAQVIGPGSLFVRFTSPLSTDNITITLTPAGAKFVTSTVPSTVQPAVISSGVSLSGAGAGTTSGSVTALPEKIVISGLNFSSFGNGSTQGIVITNISFDNATSLATAGNSITIAAEITVGGVTSIESTAATAIVTSRNSLTGTSVSNATIGQANVSATIPFASIVTSNTSALIGTINITQTGALAANLTSAIGGAAAVGTGTEIRVTTPIITGAGFSALKLTSAALAATLTRGLTQQASGSVTFSLAAADTVQGEFLVLAEFNGTTAIDTAAAGTTAITFVSAGAQSQTANSTIPAGISGTVSGISRSGLSVDVNGVQPGTAQGAATYISLLRIANTGTAAGAITVVVRNDASGATLGTYTSASIPAGASLQVSSAQIEAVAGITPVASILYRLTVSGSITGYVQHVNWNSTAGFFSDLSGRRTNTGGNTAGTGQ